MAQIRFKGFQTGSDLGTVSATIGAESGSTPVSAFQKPLAISALPRLSDGFDTDTFTVDTTGLTPSAYEWRIVGGAVQGTASTLPGSGLGGQWIECVVTSDGMDYTSPPIMVYASAHMGMAMNAGHIADDAAIKALVPHAEMTHIAIADGNWTDAATWHNGVVPRNGASVLVPHGRVVLYDQHRRYRLDRVRVDGSLTWSLAKSTDMLVETLVGTRGSEIIIGTAGGRIPAAYRHDITISGKNYASNSYTPTDLNLAADNPLWGRGILCQGTWRMWGREKTTWTRASAGVPQGATSLTLDKEPVGWDVGDTIVVGGTSITYSAPPTENDPPVTPTYQDEERVITAIDGATVSWSAPLDHPHDNQCPDSTRTDLCPVVMMKGGKNITIRSEVADDLPRRGHTAVMHHMGWADLWDAEFIDLGRTGKEDYGAVLNGDITAATEVKYYQFPEAGGAQTKPHTARSNLISRYPVHIHKIGFGSMRNGTSVVKNCYVENTLGHAMVHHDCEVDLDDNAMYKFYGAGMVGESGSEVGSWKGNLAMHCTIATAWPLDAVPKTREGERAIQGDRAAWGYGFYMTGRALRSNANVACSMPWGHVFFHRGNYGVNAWIASVLDVPRKHIDLQTVGRAGQQSNNRVGTQQGGDGRDYFLLKHVPIIHFADNESIACLTGMFVSKDLPPQAHDANVKLKRFKAWGCYRGAFLEYIATYILEDFDITGHSDGGGTGIQLGTNTMQVFIHRGRTEGFSRAILCQGGEPNMYGTTDAYVAEGQPRWGIVSVDNANCPTFVEADNEIPAPHTLNDVLFRDDDLQNDRIVLDQDPSHSYPLIKGNWDGVTTSTGSMTALVTNADGFKTDNINSTANLQPKPTKFDAIFAGSNKDARRLCNADGYWEYQGGWAIVHPNIVSDRVTGRPKLFTDIWTVSVEPDAHGSNNGPFTYGPSDPVASDILATVAENGSVVIDTLNGVSGGGGAGTYVLHGYDPTRAGCIYGTWLKPDHGVASLNVSTGTVTYTPDRGYVGPDEMYVFVESQGRYATRRIDILVGTGGAVFAPAETTNFTVADGGSQSIDVTLGDRPATGDRRILYVQFSTDGGTTWSRLCNLWPEGCTVNLTTESDDVTAIVAGSYNIRLRYKTDYDLTMSGASADAAVAVS